MYVPDTLVSLIVVGYNLELARSHIEKNTYIVANMAAIAICSSMILVIHTQHNHGTNQND
jgi:hypothetical protein